MKKHRAGKLIVIDGTDGTGKGTQSALLVKRCKREKVPVASIDFPRYAEKSAWFVEQYLNGTFGSIDDVSPEAASIFFAVDRFAAKPKMEKWLEQGRVVIANRYVTANMGHQAAKKTKKRERRELIEWLDDLEFDIFGLPRPDKTIILHVPAHIAQTLVDRKADRAYLRGKKRDIHEDNLLHLEAAERTYREIADLLPKTDIIDCMDGRRLRTVGEIHERLWHNIKTIL
jgi:dTMP kinase